jgi:hypothetical protein
MSRATLEERVAELERQVTTLLAKQTQKGSGKDWRRTRGAFTGDELMKKIFAAGRKIRQAERKRPRSRSGNQRPAHS